MIDVSQRCSMFNSSVVQCSKIKEYQISCKYNDHFSSLAFEHRVKHKSSETNNVISRIELNGLHFTHEIVG